MKIHLYDTVTFVGFYFVTERKKLLFPTDLFENATQATYEIYKFIYKSSRVCGTFGSVINSFQTQISPHNLQKSRVIF